MSESIEKMKRKRKSGLLAAVLNLFLPGLGYMYCGRILLGIFVGIILLPIEILLMGEIPLAVVPIWIIMFIDGFLASGRYNKKLEEKIYNTLKTCLQCAEKVQPEAKVCKHCGYSFVQQPSIEAVS